MNKKSFIVSAAILFVILFCALIITLLTKKTPTQQKIPIKVEQIEISSNQAIQKAGQFCKQFQLDCQEFKIDELFPLGDVGAIPDYYGVHYFWDDSYKPFGLYVSAILKGGPLKEGRNSVYWVVGGKSKEVEFFQNQATHWMIYKQNYSRLQDIVKWPEFMPEKKAKEKLDLLAAKLNMPPDMEFDKIVRDDRQGLWGGIWLRKKDGYWYEGDAVTVSIMGATGELISYTKTYRGVPCSTDIKFSREQAVDLGWAMLKESVPRNIRESLKDHYVVKDKLLIVQTNRLERSSEPVYIKGSKLAWVINYLFRVDVKYPLEKRMRIEDMTKEQRKALAEDQLKIEAKWEEMGQPEENFEVRIDAGTGELLYVSPVRSWCKKWFLR